MKKQLNQGEDVFVRRVYRHRGVNIVVEIDFLQKKISLVEPTNNGQYKGKKWLFSERTLEYMAGWQVILDAMKFAISEATKVLEEADKRETEKLFDIFRQINAKELK